ncbi:hypothetical protein [Candidatus Tremblayella endosymbiont of Pseudococcus viburni]
MSAVTHGRVSLTTSFGKSRRTGDGLFVTATRLASHAALLMSSTLRRL